ncbi:TonB-linked SusC/RagA family outer membrane protein [Catalinimonas alkaloidigena]|uniref:SusC/RagA family TonB-linked outer membrane protein n=1 Tax=Catalinimonas alkaloidigena TaxID=1075417 RepID=UPI0024074240|nr:TonB-dependent receptor [Catalinimonas alkaloidigena]MDF9798903.1 TonB-linked SusC/RagA family outer membrane protein [Catalinimonas alkaloidigena]
MKHLIFSLCFGLFVHCAMGQGITVTGTVTSSDDNDPLPGVNVLVKESTVGTITDIEGKYRLELPSSSSVLVFSFVGYESQEVSIGNEAVINVSLQPDLGQLDEVVVVGYGTQKKSSVTSAISKVENVNLDQIPAGRAETALVGRMAGVNITTSNSRPGAAPEINIRGIGSISASNDPLVVIDGFPGGSLSNVNMNDVESIEVLKDASAAAIYGSRGSGGVIIITTKQGKAGKPKLNFNAYYGISTAIKYDDWIFGQEYYDYQARYKNRDFVWEGGDPSLPLWGDERRPTTYRVNPVIMERSVDWEDELLNPAPIQNYNLSYSGASDNVSYYISGTYKNEEGTLLNTNYKTYNLRANVNVDINSVVSTGFMISPNYAKRRTAPVGMQSIVKTAPFVATELNEQGNYPRPRDYWSYSVSGQMNPLAVLHGNHNYSTSMNNVGEMFLNFNIAEGLRFKTSVGGNVTFATREYYREAMATSRNQISGSASDSRNINLINENVLSYDKSINKIHHISAILGASYQKANSRFATMGAEAGSFGNDIVRTLNNAIISPTSSYTSKSEWGLVSYFSRVNYDYENKYLLSASFRTDASSRFGPENRWGNFPSASAAWRVSEEAFMQQLAPVSELKLRASYGVVGNFNIGDFQYLGTISDTYYSPDDILVKGQAQTTFGNPELRWERTESFDIGVELGLFNNRVNFVFDYYNKNTNDLLYNVSIPAITGFTNSIINVGDVNNKGIELELTTKNFTGNFKWETSFNFSRNRNEVVGLGGVDEIINTHSRGMGWLLRVGEPMFSFYGYKLIGVLQDEEDVANSPVIPGSKPGNAKYQDTNGDGTITPEDRVILGNFQPTAFMGLINNFAWKNFDLSIIMQASLGAKRYNLENLYYEGPTVSAMRRSLIEDQWWSAEEPGDGMSPATALSQLSYVANSDYYLEDASFLAIRNINFGYTLPSTIAEKLRLNNCRLYISLSNMLLLTKDEFHGYNPEGYTQGGISGINSMPGFNNGAAPVNRAYAFGVNVNF